MAKQVWKAGNMLYPLPVVMVTVRDRAGKANIITVAWAGTVCTNPAMLSISVRPERYSYQALVDTKEFVVNLTTEKLVRATDYCGVKSGRDVDKFKETGLTAARAEKVSAPLIEESPVNIECKVKEICHLGSHDLFLAEVVSISVDEAYLNEKGKFCLNETGLVTYSHGEYFELGKKLGSFGYSVRKKEQPVRSAAKAGKGKQPNKKKDGKDSWE